MKALSANAAADLQSESINAKERVNENITIFDEIIFSDDEENNND